MKPMKHKTKQIHVRPDADLVPFIQAKPRGWLSKLVNKVVREEMEKAAK
jgi:uncharacterized protein (DUF4415 family)